MRSLVGFVIEATQWRRLYIDLDNVIVHFSSAFARTLREQMEDYKGRLDEIPGIFSRMEPMPLAVGAFVELAALFDTYILSIAPWQNSSAWSDKLEWGKTHLGPSAPKRVILNHHKNRNYGRFLVDDRTKNGADRFVGEHIHFGAPRVPNWEGVLIYLRARAL